MKVTVEDLGSSLGDLHFSLLLKNGMSLYFFKHFVYAVSDVIIFSHVDYFQRFAPVLHGIRPTSKPNLSIQLYSIDTETHMGYNAIH